MVYQDFWKWQQEILIVFLLDHAVGYDLQPTHFISQILADLLQTYIKCFSTFYCGQQSYGCNPSLIYAESHSHSSSRRQEILVVSHLLIGSCCMLRQRHPTLFILMSNMRLQPQPDNKCFVWQSLESLLVSNFQCVVGYDWGNSPTSYSEEVFFIYIYNAIQHLLQWIQVIRMQLQPVIAYMGPKSGCCRCVLGRELL